jgi:hypothetical protein
MDEPTSTADLEIRLRRATGTAALVDLTVRQPSGQADSQLISDALAQFDLDALRAELLDPIAYGRTLARQLFADARLRDAWNTVITHPPSRSISTPRSSSLGSFRSTTFLSHRQRFRPDR